MTTNSLHRKSAMWLPGPLYESLPYLYGLAGILFFVGTFYIGLDAPAATLYLACGVICLVSGAYIFGLRLVARRKLGRSGAMNRQDGRQH